MPRVAACDNMQEMILDAADRLIGRYGYKKTTMDDLAREAGIGKGTIYLYFPSKEEVALSCVDRCQCRVQGALREIAESHGSPEERLRRMMIARVMIRFDQARRFTESLDEIYAAVRRPLLNRREKHVAAEAGIIAEILIQGQAEGVFNVSNPLKAAEAITLASNSLMPSNLSVRELGAREEIEEKAAAIADLALTGILKRER
jgi:AcrR family transcriptional regulator